MDDGEDIESFNDASHSKLLNAVAKLDRTQHIKVPTRSEPTNLTTEFHLIKNSKKLDINNIVKVLKNTAHQVDISKKLRKTQNNSNILVKPLEKPQAERVKRSTGYEATKKKIGRWDAVVARNRTVDYLTFPLKSISNKLESTSVFLSKLKRKSALELELDEIDPPLVEEEEEDIKYPMSYAEMLEHRKNLAKLRAQESFKAAKAKRQSKIKSKKYHRVLKKEKMKQQIKEFEELQKIDPEEALRKIEALEKARALERHTLRHKNTGKWAKSKLIRAKYDKEVRQQLAEQLAVGRNMAPKSENIESSDSEENDEGIADISLSQDPMNPWMMKRSDTSNNISEFDFGYKKYLKDKMYKNKNVVSESESDNEAELESNQNSLKKLLNTDSLNLKSSFSKEITQIPSIKLVESCTNDNSIQREKTKELISTSDWVVELVQIEAAQNLEDIDEAFDNLKDTITVKVEEKLKKLKQNLELHEKSQGLPKKKPNSNQSYELESLYLNKTKVRPIIDDSLDETTKKNIDNPDRNQNNLLNIATVKLPNMDVDNSNIDPSKFIEAKPKYLNTALSIRDNNVDELDDEQVVPKVNIEEVFEEDDVVSSFRKEKEEEASKGRPTDVDLTLPGWGTWAGKGIKSSRRKQRRFILKAPPKFPRRDENKGDVIIREYKDPKLAVHKITEVPFPFTSVKDFEASIRAPLGNTFVPEKAHQKLIKPSVVTKAGTIIEPMDEEQLLVPRNLNYNNTAVIKLLAKK